MPEQRSHQFRDRSLLPLSAAHPQVFITISARMAAIPPPYPPILDTFKGGGRDICTSAKRRRVPEWVLRPRDDLEGYGGLRRAAEGLSEVTPPV